MSEHVDDKDFCNRCGDYKPAGEKHKCGTKPVLTKELMHRGRGKKNHGTL